MAVSLKQSNNLQATFDTKPKKQECILFGQNFGSPRFEKGEILPTRKKIGVPDEFVSNDPP